MAAPPLVIESVRSWTSTLGDTALPKVQRPSATCTHPWRRFLRVVEEPSCARLQTSKLVYRRDDGVRVDLIGAIHIGERDYYQGFNTSFKNYDVLLYERLKTHAKATEEAKDIEHVLSLQRWMKDELNLEMQVNQIDYQAKNLIHADLDLQTLSQMQSSQDESFLKLMDSMHQAWTPDADAEPAQAATPHPISSLIYDDQGQRRESAEIKLLLARQLQNIELIVAAIEGIQGTVVLKERNKYVIEMLQKTLDRGIQKIGIFYGAAHMMEIAQRLTQDLGFTLKRTYWHTAWDIAKASPGSYASVPAYSSG